MPTYFNGKEIKNTSKINGLSLSGRSSIKIDSRIISIDSRPRPITYTFSDTTGSRNPTIACQIGPDNPQFILYGDSKSSIKSGILLYTDEDLTVLFTDPVQYYYNFETNQYVKFDPSGSGKIAETGPCGR